MEMQVYIANIGKYNEGELVGDWFTPPIDFDIVKEQIGLNDEYEEYAIHDYELPFDVGEYTTISEINRKCALIEELEGTEFYDNISEFMNYWFNDIEELIENKDDIICYPDCDSMEDVARYYVEETGSLGEFPSNFQNYIDYQALGRDMELEGRFLITAQGIFEYIG
ncbi:antirestriction protein ArdA [Listeria innocua]|uniref:antirestriction protein ArdA n=1 Tax=Listeria innocua TaxID=1642 RepID=UPI001078AEF9|nr:antirestriction protein ArdA [Listeria innocua]EAC6254281.1 antirestriction protein ArdA [Listeria monocytogenes]EAA0094400.1 antirestriction protein ArdA [Listeria innocua]EIL5148087.1 antirestriction protein ArdA [Listeria innocua]EIL5150895.1 antirestriction protein ArdA [Listeria innocua]EIL5178660.1 antirestriction protein ArdA [Listeria innocua]